MFSCYINYYIPKDWKKCIAQNKMDFCSPGNVFMFRIGNTSAHISSLSTNQIYKLLMKMGTTECEPFCVKFWHKNLGRHLCPRQWNNIFTFKIKYRIENKLGHFQFNLLYNLIPCKKNLFTWKLSDTDKCTFCNCVDEYNHYFVACSRSVIFWKLFRECLYVVTNKNTNVDLESIIYGWNMDQSSYDFANLLLIIASYSVYTAKIRYSETLIFTPIWLIFYFHIKKLNTIFKNLKKTPTLIIENRTEWNDLRTYLNIV